MLCFALKRAATSVLSAGPGPHFRRPACAAHRALSAVGSAGRSEGGDAADPVALQMINYALTHARSQNSEDSYAQALLVLEQGLSNSTHETTAGALLLAMSHLLYERGRVNDAMEKLKMVLDLGQSSMGVRVTAYEGLIRLNLEEGQDVTSSVLAYKCLQILGSRAEDEGPRIEALHLRANAAKGLVDLVVGNIASAESHFKRFQYNDSLEDQNLLGQVALSHGEFYHVTGNFSLAKGFYHKAMEASDTNGSSEAFAVASVNVNSEASIGATCALGQLATHSGDFQDAEETLTKALTKAEEHFGSSHPNVGVILTCIGIMFGHKAKLERSSSILIQEGLYRRAIDLLKAPSLESEVAEMVKRRDVMALARGGYAEVLCVQQNRKAEGERMKKWAESVWRNHRLTLTQALEISEPSKVAVIDTRFNRVI